jgi:hypothetical protein
MATRKLTKMERAVWAAAFVDALNTLLPKDYTTHDREEERGAETAAKCADLAVERYKLTLFLPYYESPE